MLGRDARVGTIIALPPPPPTLRGLRAAVEGTPSGARRFGTAGGSRCAWLRPWRRGPHPRRLVGTSTGGRASCGRDRRCGERDVVSGDEEPGSWGRGSRR